MKITNKFNMKNTAELRGRKIEYIVVHYTAGVTSKPGSAASTANYFATTTNEVSSDFIVDDTAVVQYNGDIENRYTWHCGGSKYNNKGGSFYGKCTNRNSIGIEVCSTNSTGTVTNANDKFWSFTDAVVENTAELVRYLMEKYHISADHVIRHYDVNGKPCPGIIGWNIDSGDNSKWREFKSKISGNTAIYNDKKVLYRVRKSWADAKSQIGAFENLDNAKSACKSGYSVFDEGGNVVFSNAVKSYAKGAEIMLKNATLYSSATAESGTKRSGTYFIYDGLVVNGRMRITNDRKNCGNTPIGRYVTGWVKKSDI